MEDFVGIFVTKITKIRGERNMWFMAECIYTNFLPFVKRKIKLALQFNMQLS